MSICWCGMLGLAMSSGHERHDSMHPWPLKKNLANAFTTESRTFFHVSSSERAWLIVLQSLWLYGVEAGWSPVFLSPLMKRNAVLLISSSVSVCGGGDKAVWYQTQWSDPCMNGQSSLILSVEGKKEKHRKEMSRIVNVVNIVISHRKELPKELYSRPEEQRQICTNKRMGAPANDSLGQRNFSC